MSKCHILSIKKLPYVIICILFQGAFIAESKLIKAQSRIQKRQNPTPNKRQSQTAPKPKSANDAKNAKI
ncbi:hypothetical protein BKN38_09620 [Helicobacter sp. CLO-3]|nr:hypothetical protein BA723_08900 [Helicobacter sp. CLO-3]OHU81163.1 hypothetical protein BKN38_09620 [Helicobacter sp. CLO-3]